MLASVAVGVLLAHANVVVALVAIGIGIPAIALATLPALLRADRTSAAAAARLRPLVELMARDRPAGRSEPRHARAARGRQPTAGAIPAGRVVIREGDKADALWVLLRGELSVRDPRGMASPGPATCRRSPHPATWGSSACCTASRAPPPCRRARTASCCGSAAGTSWPPCRAASRAGRWCPFAGTRMARTPWVWPSAPARRADVTPGGEAP